MTDFNVMTPDVDPLDPDAPITYELCICVDPTQIFDGETPCPRHPERTAQ